MRVDDAICSFSADALSRELSLKKVFTSCWFAALEQQEEEVSNVRHDGHDHDRPHHSSLPRYFYYPQEEVADGDLQKKHRQWVEVLRYKHLLGRL